MHIKQSHISNAQPNLLKVHVFPTHGLTERIKNENTTRHRSFGESTNIKDSTFNKLYKGLIGSRIKMPNVLYTHPLAIIQRNFIIQFNQRMQEYYKIINKNISQYVFIF